MIQLDNHRATVGIQDGELISYVVQGHEFIHQKGSPGWGSSDTEMFPVIGPLEGAGYRVMTPKGPAIEDQHGHLRQMPYTLEYQGETSARFIKRYTRGTRVVNAKYPGKSAEPYMDWPYSFEFEKSFALMEDRLEIGFRVTGDQGMPFMLGYHPAFKLYGGAPLVLAQGRKITLEEVLAVGSRALQLADCTVLTLRDQQWEITLETEGFGHFMCWTEVDNMVCLEPISFYPYAVEQGELHQGFQFLDGESLCKVVLIPGGTAAAH